LGSSQIRLEFGGEVWVVSGDYKREPDSTCEPFEIVPCDVFVTEATFGTPAYQWPKERNLARDIFTWWRRNAESGSNSVLFAYSLGKTQRVLGALEPLVHEMPGAQIYCHPAATLLNEKYRDEGIRLATAKCLSTVSEGPVHGGLFIVPSAFMKSEQVRILGENFKTAFASGWMAQGHFGYDNGFLMSDHADWNDLLQTIKETGATRVYVQHRGHGSLVKHLRSLGITAHPDSELTPENPNQLALF
jgi:putative mRNA 3-end processing factor